MRHVHDINVSKNKLNRKTISKYHAVNIYTLMFDKMFNMNDRYVEYFHHYTKYEAQIQLSRFSMGRIYIYIVKMN